MDEASSWNWLNVIPIAVSFAALFLSGWARASAWNVNKKTDKYREEQFELQRKTLELQRTVTELRQRERDELEAARKTAVLRVSFTPYRNFHQVRVTNVGKGVARNVQLRILDERSPLIPSDVDEKLPWRELRPGEHFAVGAAESSGCTPPWDATLAWLDEDGNPQQRSVKIS